MSNITEIMNLTDREKCSLMAFLCGYSPEEVEKAFLYWRNV